jgi:hypothetical protein
MAPSARLFAVWAGVLVSAGATACLQASVCKAEPAHVQRQVDHMPIRMILTGRPVFSLDGVRLGRVTDMRFTSEGTLELIQAELDDGHGHAARRVVMTRDEFEPRADRFQLKLDARQVWSALQGADPEQRLPTDASIADEPQNRSEQRTEHE